MRSCVIGIGIDIETLAGRVYIQKDAEFLYFPSQETGVVHVHYADMALYFFSCCKAIAANRRRTQLIIKKMY